jgi:dTDP-4-amino-4,6-dideoxygalactose transaminase
VPAWGWRELAATSRSLVTGSVIEGDAPTRFAAAVADQLGVRYALPLNRGRTAIEIGLRALGVGAGDEVVLPSFVCRSVLDAVLGSGATPVFADIDQTLNVTRASVEAALTPRTRAVIVAHLFGTAAPVDEIETMLAPRGIALIDDAAQAFGVRRAGRALGSFGNCGIVCCGPGKPLAGAAGGLLVTDDRGLFEKAAALELSRELARDVTSRIAAFWMWRRLRRYTLPFKIGLDRLRRPREEPAHVNAPMSNMDAAAALAQLSRLEQHAADRRRNARELVAHLSRLPGMVLTDLSSSAVTVKLVYLLPASGPAVDSIIEALAADGIEAQGGYAPLHRGYAPDDKLPITAELWRRVLCVPVETRLPRTERRVVNARVAWNESTARAGSSR